MIRRFFQWCWAKRWRRWTLIAALPVFLIVNIGVVELTSQSSFCKSCHIMEPYYTSWRHSSHKDVECVKCHISPGVDNFVAAKLNGLGQVVDDLLYRTSTKPSASVSQLACTRPGCHTVESITAHKIDNGKFKFDHAKHLGSEVLGIKIECGTCHAHVKGSDHFEVNTDACVTCHLLTRYNNGGNHQPMRSESQPIFMAVRDYKPAVPNAPPSAPGSGPAPGSPEAAEVPPSHGKSPPANCTACHNPPLEPFDYRGLTVDHTQFLSYGAACESCHRNVTAKPEPIDDAKCLTCHTFGADRSLPVAEMHRVHAEGHHKVECFSCHGVTRHGTQAQLLSLGQFDCRACHKDQHGVQQQAYLFTGASPHADGGPVSPMFLAHVDCAGCHVQQDHLKVKPESTATVAKATPQSCDACHQPGLGERLIPRWQADTHALFDELEAQLAAIGPAPAGDEAGVKARVDEARGLLNLIRTDGSWGVHNPRYTQQLLERARSALREARGLPPLPPPRPPEASADPVPQPGATPSRAGPPP